MAKPKQNLTRHQILLATGDAEHLQKYFPHSNLSKIVRNLVRQTLQNLDAKTAEKLRQQMENDND